MTTSTATRPSAEAPVAAPDATRVDIDAAQLPPRERAEAIRDAIWRHVVRVEIEHRTAADIEARCALRTLGQVTLCSVRSNAGTITRTRGLARDDSEPSVFLGLQAAGSSMVIQHGREAVLRPGEMALYDTTQPYTLVNAQGIDQHYFRLPRSALGLPAGAIDDATAVTFGADHPLAAVAAAYFGRIAIDGGRDRAAAEALSVPSIELVRALIATRLGSTRLARDPLAETLVIRVLEYTRAHLGDAGLTPAKIAAHHHVSVRRLYGALADAEISLAAWIRDQRLERCRIELTRPVRPGDTIAKTAARWGFLDPTHFSRAFRAAYGVTPSQWRSRSGA